MQSRTPPDLKWLLNERAALVGKATKAQAKKDVLTVRREKLERQVANAAAAIEAAQRSKEQCLASIAALDAIMEMVDTKVNVGAGGKVNAWAGRYGPRGGLIAFISRVLEKAAPQPLTTTVLVDLAARQFGVTFNTPDERRSFRKSVCSALTGLHKRELIAPLHSRGQGSHGLWRWGQPLPSLAEMAAASEEAKWR